MKIQMAIFLLTLLSGTVLFGRSVDNKSEVLADTAKKNSVPQASVLGHAGSFETHSAEAGAATGITIQMNDSSFAGIQVISFEMSYKVNKFEFLHKGSGNSFTPVMQAVMKNAKPGDWIYFHTITCKMPDGRIKMAVPVQFKIIE